MDMIYMDDIYGWMCGGNFGRGELQQKEMRNLIDPNVNQCWMSPCFVYNYFNLTQRTVIVVGGITVPTAGLQFYKFGLNCLTTQFLFG